VFFTPVAGATRYRIELSRDMGATWDTVAHTTDSKYQVSGLKIGAKVHVRVTALNREQERTPGDEYPIYVTDQPPLPPDGLRTRSVEGGIALQWGEVLGVREYVLYRRVKGNTEYAEVFRGLAQSRVDVLPKAGSPVFEYAVSAVDGNGEGRRSAPVNTDPATWLNWEPKTSSDSF
jgi:hypothetical protein